MQIPRRLRRGSSFSIQVDDFYHLRRADQPLVLDFIHRLCKDLPLFFKVATLRHASILYAELGGQPTGAQERHDYQPINIDFTFHDFKRTSRQLKRIFNEYGKRAEITSAELDGLFKGDGFDRLVLAGGGIPRDCLSLFLEALSIATSDGDGRIGKDDVRQLSLSTFQRRIEELKKDSEQKEHDRLLHAVYALREFCLSKEVNYFVASEKDLQENDTFRSLIFRLLDYRIIHSVGSAYTHKTHSGSYSGFIIDTGSYAHLRKLFGKVTELELDSGGAKEVIRSAPILGVADLEGMLKTSKSIEQAMSNEQIDQDA